MKHRVFGMMMSALAGLWLAAVPAFAQTPAATAEAGSRSTWTPARTPDGQPDIQGMWEGGARFQEQGVDFPQITIGAADCRVVSNANRTEGLGDPNAGTPCAAYVPLFSGLLDGKGNFGRGAPAAPPRRRGLLDVPDGKLPWTLEGAAKRARNMANLYNPPTPEFVDPTARCVPTWQPGGTSHIVQTPGYVALLFETNHVSRIIPVDGRRHVGPEIRLFQGDSVGRWEGTTLVVDTTNFVGTGWYDMVGAPQSDALHVIERFTIVDRDTMDYVVTIEDSKLFTRPWSYAGSFRRAESAEVQRVQTAEMLEYACVEGSRAFENALERPGRPLPPEVRLPR